MVLYRGQKGSKLSFLFLECMDLEIENNIFVCLFVFHNSTKSYLKNLTCGVPPGLILGPFLFTLYVNDMTSKSTLLELILFADDTTILFSSDDICSEAHKINKE